MNDERASSEQFSSDMAQLFTRVFGGTVPGVFSRNNPKRKDLAKGNWPPLNPELAIAAQHGAETLAAKHAGDGPC